MTLNNKELQADEQITEGDLTASSLLSVKLSSNIGLITCWVFGGLIAGNIEFPFWIGFLLAALAVVTLYATFGFSASKIMDFDLEDADEWQNQMAQYTRSTTYETFMGILGLAIPIFFVLDFFKVNVSLSMDASDITYFLGALGLSLYFLSRNILANKIKPLNDEGPSDAHKTTFKSALTGQNWVGWVKLFTGFSAAVIVASLVVIIIAEALR